MIGIFDSGSGGLTVLARIRERLPTADILYFGDVRNAPYGERSREELTSLTIAAMERLQQGGATRIVSACNSVSASLAASLESAAPAHLIEMVGPTVASLKDFSGRLLVCATQATISSGMYQDAFRMVGKEVRTCAIPHLAGAIQQGAEDEELAHILAPALTGVDRSIDAVLLACTHYPLVPYLFAQAFPDATLIDPAHAVARRVEETWGETEQGTGSVRFILSTESSPFRRLVARFMPEGGYEVEVVE